MKMPLSRSTVAVIIGAVLSMSLIGGCGNQNGGQKAAAPPAPTGNEATPKVPPRTKLGAPPPGMGKAAQ